MSKRPYRYTRYGKNASLESADFPIRWRTLAGFLGLSAAAALALFFLFLPDPEEPTPGNRPVSDWALDLMKAQPETRQKAADALKTAGNQAVPTLRRALRTNQNTFADLARRATRKLPLGPLASWADTNGDAVAVRTRVMAAKALGELEEEAVQAIPALAAALHDPSQQVQSEAIQALGKIGPVTLPELIAALQRNDPHVQGVVLSVLSKMGPEAAQAAPVVLELLGTSNHRIRNLSAYTLMRMQQEGFPALFLALNHQNRATRQLAANLISRDPITLMKLEPDHYALFEYKQPGKVAKALIAALQHPETEVQIAASRALATRPPGLENHVPELLDALRNPEPQVRAWCAVALGELRSNARIAMGDLETLRSDENSIARRAAVYALDQIKATADP